MPDAVNPNDVKIKADQHDCEVKFTEYFSEAKSGVKIYRYQWEPVKDTPRALLFIAHGYAEHAHRYVKFARLLCSELGCLVFSHDHVGHGKSEGERVMVNTFDVYVDDIFEHVDEVRTGYPELPLYLFGHSMGGSLAILAACKRPEFSGVVLSAPAIILDPKLVPGRIMTFISNVLLHFFPGMEALPPIDPNLISSDPAQVKAYADDPLIWHGGIKLRVAKSFSDAFARIEEQILSIQWPFLVLHGDCDQIVYMGGSQLLAKKAKSEDKEIKIYKGLKHEILNEVKKDADRVMSDIVEWLKSRIQAK